VFERAGVNGRKTESFAFTAHRPLASIGLSVGGARWKRPTIPWQRADRERTFRRPRLYLSRGGLGFLIGDGALRLRGPEWRLGKLLHAPRNVRCLRPPSTSSTPPTRPSTATVVPLDRRAGDCT